MPRRACAARSTCTATSPSQRDELRPGGIVEDLSVAVAKEQDSLAGDVDALVMALDARAALEIGITQSLGNALSIEAERDALVARLRAFTPLVRGTSASHVARYIRADDAFHRIFLSLLRNQPLFDIYNAMDVPELMRRVLRRRADLDPRDLRRSQGADERPACRQRRRDQRRHHRARQPRPHGSGDLPRRHRQSR